MLVKLHENSLIARVSAYKLKQSSVAVTIGKHIYLHGIDKENFLQNKDWVCHELAHVEQYNQHGFFKFIFLYLKESYKKGYSNNRFEIEANNREQDESLLMKYQVK